MKTGSLLCYTAALLLALGTSPAASLAVPRAKTSSAAVNSVRPLTRLHAAAGSDIALDAPRGGGESGGTATIPNEVL